MKRLVYKPRGEQIDHKWFVAEHVTWVEINLKGEIVTPNKEKKPNFVVTVRLVDNPEEKEVFEGTWEECDSYVKENF